MTTRAMVVEGGFGLDKLVLRERDDVEPKPGEIAIEMRAASLNYRDLRMVRGEYNPRQPLPLVPLSDGVGKVVAKGEGVTDIAVGDRVCPLFVQSWHAGEPTKEKLGTTLGGPIDGVLRERMTVPSANVVKIPAKLSDAEAACLPCAYLTAWSALVEQGNLAAGETVLVQGTGGVSIAALQIARAMGARVIATSSSDEKLARAKELGANELVNYKSTPAWGKRAVELTGGRGVDHVVEVGGAGTLGESLRAVRPGGTVSVIGVLASAATEVNVLPILMRNVRLQGVFVGHKEGFVRMNRAIELLGIKPVVGDTFAWTEARAALEHMEAGKHFAKIALTF
ncbi:MAG: NAD(P)-dependent alcohol dehydrogenase [Polyangiaceae bacterium]|nr:NAD(P)-dependent alcohol dehydrogenase [Polyangiaceae bacterium]